jgi:Outer membrane protein beta-barrel domain
MTIKKILPIILVFASFQVPAQTLWGLKGGANVSTLGSTGQYKPRLGYHLGAFYSQHIEDQYGWQIGLQYSLQGARDAANTNGRLAYHYINMPLVMKFYFSESTFAEVGPQISYLLSAKYSETGFKDDRTDGVQRWDFSGLIGLGHETDSGASMGLRFGFGFINTSGASVGNSVVFRNLLFQAYIGLKLKEFGS